MSRLALGTPVTVTIGARLVRRDGAEVPHERCWEPLSPSAAEPVDGIVVGWRTLRNGTVEYNYEEPAIFTTTGTVGAYVIAFDLNRSPWFVLPDDVKTR